MDKKILAFLKNNRVCALSIMLPDGSPHSAAMHYSHQENPLKLFFSTDKTSFKCKGIENSSQKSSVVIGFSETEWITLQLHGEIMMRSNTEEIKKIKQIHYLKHPKSQEFENDPDTVFLEFTPQWWRYTDYNEVPPLIISSD